ncbi:TMEM62 [Cordylochernes scorpioides]|uniref:TMEM62 n=1 Tax=Cordylochernes scorpioides TaxID=51811 RepID=A0ABY6KV34_9ARAC|nr:TMEM62 [Cordylochernes scorpioides]
MNKAWPDAAAPVKTYLETLKWEFLPHPQYSPDIAPSDYNLFQSIQHGLADQHFSKYNETSVDHSTANLLEVWGKLQEVPDIVTEFIIVHDIPDAITGQNEELVTLLNCDLRLRGDQLFTGPLALHLFVLKISQSPRDCKRAIYPLDHHTSSCPLNTVFLLRIDGLVILCGEDSLALSAKHASGIPAIGNEKMIFGLDDRVQKIFCTVSTYPCPSMAIKYSKEAPVLEAMRQPHYSTVGILHLNSPALHATEGIAESIARASLHMLLKDEEGDTAERLEIHKLEAEENVSQDLREYECQEIEEKSTAIRNGKLPDFYGNPLVWPTFIHHYRQLTQDTEYSSAQNMRRLEKALKGEARNSVCALMIVHENAESSNN